MNCLARRFTVAAVAALALVLLWWGAGASPVLAQDEEFIPEESDTTDAPADFSAIDDLLKQDEEVLSDPEVYSYDPGLVETLFVRCFSGEHKLNVQRSDRTALLDC